MQIHVSVTVTATPPNTVGFVPILMPWCSCPPLAAVAGEPPPTYSPGALEEHVREVRADGLQGPLPGTSVVVIVRAQWLAPAPSPPGPPPAAPTNTVAPAITGTPAVGQLLTVSNGTWTGTPLVFNYQWKANGTNVGSAVNTYTPTSADIGKTITCTVTAVNAGGSTPATSAGVGPVTSGAPVNTVAPAISGTAQVGATLTATPGTWTNSPTSYAYQWKSGGANVGSNSSTYVPVTGDIGNTITVTVTATNAQGSTPATSAATSAVLPAAPTNTVLPVITGTPQVGSVLTVSDGTWTGSPTSFSYQWYADGSPVGP
jgi:hypothetical protein